MKNQKKYKRACCRILTSLAIATIGLYALIFSAKYFGAVYNITDGEYFIVWALLSILVSLSTSQIFKK
tara:strand:+ start:1632 stop:1835 length:204 start_codon:yes stop_codon:yes gene_type:complete